MSQCLEWLWLTYHRRLARGAGEGKRGRSREEGGIVEGPKERETKVRGKGSGRRSCVGCEGERGTG
jgi:hypothetical protein